MKTCVINSDGLHYDVFISSKSEDYSIAEEVYDFLRDNGFYVFFADKELPKLANSQYSIEIDKALAATKHLIVVFSNVDYLSSPWVLHEWSSFSNDLKDNIRKEGNLLLITTADILKNRKCDIPESLRHHQSFFIDNYKTSRILDFLPSCVHSSVKNGKGHFSMPEQMMRGIPELGKAQPVVDLTTLSSSDDIMHFNHALKFDRMLRPRRALDELRKISKQDDLIVRYYTLRIRYTLEGGVDENELEDVFVKACNLGCVDARVNLASKYLDDWDSKGAANASVNQCLEWLQAAIAEGEPEALVELANVYNEGKHGVSQDKSIAERLFRQAIYAGSLAGRVGLGFFYVSKYFDNNRDVKSRVMAEDVLRPILMKHLLKNEADADKVVHWIIALAYMQGIVVQKDYSLAIYFLKKVMSSKGKSLPQDDILLSTTWLWLGIIYLDQNGGFKNYQEAFKCFAKASEIGTRDGTAENQLGMCYEKGIGIDKDECMAIKYYRLAADKGCASALFSLAMDSLSKDNDTESQVQLSQAVEKGDDAAKLVMGLYLCEGAYFTKNETRGMELIKESADSKNAEAMERLGLIFLCGLYGTEKDVKKAEEWLTRAAESGNASAECNLGTRYAEGDFGTEDKQKAVYWWNRAAEHGDVDAMYNMGHAYLSGVGVMANPHIAFDWFRKAADQGSVEAMLALGAMCLDKKYGMVDKVQGEKWVKQAADTGDADALNSYAVLFYNGAFGDADKPKAIELWKQAADKKCSAAMVSIGECYRDGEGVPADVKQAIQWFERAIELGDTRAMKQLGWTFLKDEGALRNIGRAKSLFEQAAGLGDVEAMCALGAWAGGDRFGEVDYESALKWYSQAVELGSVEAMEQMGLLYLQKDWSGYDVKKAENWLIRAAESGNASAECNLGARYVEGDFGTEDKQKAVYWWNRAAEHGDVDAMCNMGTAYRNGDGVMADLHIAFDWFRKAANQGTVPVSGDGDTSVICHNNSISDFNYESMPISPSLEEKAQQLADEKIAMERLEQVQNEENRCKARIDRIRHGIEEQKHLDSYCMMRWGESPSEEIRIFSSRRFDSVAKMQDLLSSRLAQLQNSTSFLERLRRGNELKMIKELLMLLGSIEKERLEMMRYVETSFQEKVHEVEHRLSSIGIRTNKESVYFWESCLSEYERELHGLIGRRRRVENELDRKRKERELDEVYSSIFAPAEVKRKSPMQVQVYIHLYEETEKVKKFAQESDKNAERRDYIPLQCKLKKGDKVDVLLNIYGETLLMSDKKNVVWQGTFTKCSFNYFVPKDIDVDDLSCVAVLSVNGVPVGEMRFVTRIVDAPKQLNSEIIAHKYNKVFISYSHQDESKVKFLHEGLELGAVPHFFDREYLKAGDVFPQVIQDYINSSDLFILCWSENASKSEYVKKERLQALERAFPQVQPEKEAKLRIYPISIEPRAELPSDMKENYHFGEL